MVRPTCWNHSKKFLLDDKSVFENPTEGNIYGEIITLNDFRWSADLISWKDKLVQEGDTDLPVPRNLSPFLRQVHLPPHKSTLIGWRPFSFPSKPHSTGFRNPNLSFIHCCIWSYTRIEWKYTGRSLGGKISGSVISLKSEFLLL